jgi:hypothetical protein
MNQDVSTRKTAGGGFAGSGLDPFVVAGPPETTLPDWETAMR